MFKKIFKKCYNLITVVNYYAYVMVCYLKNLNFSFYNLKDIKLKSLTLWKLYNGKLSRMLEIIMWLAILHDYIFIVDYLSWDIYESLLCFIAMFLAYIAMPNNMGMKFMKKISYKIKKWLKKKNNLLFINYTNKNILIMIFYLILMNVKWGLLDMIYFLIHFKVMEAIIIMLMMVLISAYISLLESQVVGILQQRFGPSLTGGFWALLQPMADGFKLIIKEIMWPSKAKMFLFLSAPVYTFVLTLSIWTLIPLTSNTKTILWNKEYTLLIFLIMLTFATYGSILGGWSSNNKYALLGSYSSIALSGSYGITMGLLFCFPVLYAQSFNLFIIVYEQTVCWYIFPLFEVSFFFWIIMLTEIKKVPFDVSESEAELSSGYLIEYSGFNFALFIISEYASIFFFVTLYILLFLGGWLPFETSFFILDNSIFSIFTNWFNFLNMIKDFWLLMMKICFMLFIYLVMSTVLPNYSFDYMMVLHWKYLFPFILMILIFNLLLF